jgi:hypothetical protein
MKRLHSKRRRREPVLSPDEYKRRRREHRLQRIAHSEVEIRAWAEARGCLLRVLNGSQHWLFQKPGFMAEWWPSSAKLAVNRDYLHAHHAPHWQDVLVVLNRYLPALSLEPPLLMSHPGNFQNPKP